MLYAEVVMLGGGLLKLPPSTFQGCGQPVFKLGLLSGRVKLEFRFY